MPSGAPVQALARGGVEKLRVSNLIHDHLAERAKRLLATQSTDRQPLKETVMKHIMFRNLRKFAASFGVTYTLGAGSPQGSLPALYNPNLNSPTTNNQWDGSSGYELFE
jgi:hypothetical protein